MNGPIPINLAVEDPLSESVLRRLLTDSGKEYAIGTAYSRGGFGYLRRTIRGFNNAARSTPFLVLTDLDEGLCAPELLESWLGAPRHPNLLFRVAIREVEAWLVGDRVGLLRFLGLSRHTQLPQDPDAIEDPKRFIIDLARRSPRRDLKSDIVPAANSTARVGRNYNGRLSDFVKSHWSPSRASATSESLNRAFQAVRAFTPSWAAPE